MVGAHPKWPWPTTRKAIPESILHVVEQKTAELAQLRVEIERGFLLVDLTINGMGDRNAHTPDPSQCCKMETWLAVRYGKDQIAKHISNIEKHPQGALHWGTLYRGIYKGNLPWPETESAREACMQIVKMDWKDLGDDMILLRKHAANVVKTLATNELMIDPDAHVVGY